MPTITDPLKLADTIEDAASLILRWGHAQMRQLPAAEIEMIVAALCGSEAEAILREIDASGVLYAHNLELDAKVANFLSSRRPQLHRPPGGQVTPSQDRMKAAVAYLQKFMATYDQQLGYLDYTDETYINDVLYGLGVSLGGEHQFAGGFEVWKDKLRKHLTRSNAAVGQQSTKEE